MNGDLGVAHFEVDSRLAALEKKGRGALTGMVYSVAGFVLLSIVRSSNDGSPTS